MQRTPGSQSGTDQLAQRVCTACKTRKRKCNKALPKCSSCTKSHLKCDYSQPEKNHSPAIERLWHTSFVADDRPNTQSIDFPTMLFLDPEILQYGQIEIPRVLPPVPAHVLHFLGDMDEIRFTASKFFDHIHLWMPFISKKRFYEIHLRPSFHSQPDIVLLLLSLKLITTFPPKSPRNPRTPLYYATKHFYLELEGSSIFSVPILQAGVLISLYELGHAIHPAAFLSIGASARYAQALGINSRRTLNPRRVFTLVEVEEKRRIWWAIVILDRFVNVGCPGRPFVTADPRSDDLLPADDAAWDQGIVSTDESFTLSSPMTGHMSKFALLCQAVRLLGEVLHHVSSDMATHDDIWKQLDRTLQSMVAASLNTEYPDYDQIIFIHNALIALHTPWLFSNGRTIMDEERSQYARGAIQQISEKISENLVGNQCFLGRNPEDIPPWGPFFAYRMCGAHTRDGRLTSDSATIVKSLKEMLLHIDNRWNVAGAYLQLLEAQQVINSF